MFILHSIIELEVIKKSQFPQNVLEECLSFNTFFNTFPLFLTFFFHIAVFTTHVSEYFKAFIRFEETYVQGEKGRNTSLHNSVC